MTILVTGGAGYIGSHTVFQLIDAGHKVVVLDDLRTGNLWAVHPKATFIKGDCGDKISVTRLIEQHRIEAVIHFAASLQVHESVIDPLKYYSNNIAGSLALIQACAEKRVNKFIFSSSAAVYGQPKIIPVSEESEKNPCSPYGYSKLVVERMLADVGHSLQMRSQDFRHVSLRYFNVAGARADAKLGQATPNCSILIKICCEVAIGKRPKLTIYGSDYPTNDGTCIRDYIHVEDLANAHILALNYLDGGGASTIYNCGYGHGYSVNDVVGMVKQVSGINFPVEYGARREGDPAQVIALADKIKNELNWIPQCDDLGLICDSAWNWEKKLRDGKVN